MRPLASLYDFTDIVIPFPGIRKALARPVVIGVTAGFFILRFLHYILARASPGGLYFHLGFAVARKMASGGAVAPMGGNVPGGRFHGGQRSGPGRSGWRSVLDPGGGGGKSFFLFLFCAGPCNQNNKRPRNTSFFRSCLYTILQAW